LRIKKDQPPSEQGRPARIKRLSFKKDLQSVDIKTAKTKAVRAIRILPAKRLAIPDAVKTTKIINLPMKSPPFSNVDKKKTSYLSIKRDNWP
jgi:hypothetical protein